LTVPESNPNAPTEVVAIDGPSGAGKSTIARRLAERLGYGFLDTGAMFRAVTWHFLASGVVPDGASAAPTLGEAGMRDALADADLQLDAGRILLNGEDVTPNLRTREVEARVSAVSALSFVRVRMADLQRQVARRGPIVAEGRDMGSVVFPQARWKVYLDAAPTERARRRCEDFAAQGREVSQQDVLEEILARDLRDSTRADAPLKRSPEALYVDSTGMTAAAVIELLVEHVRTAQREAL
jgi:cytidylate kinase